MTPDPKARFIDSVRACVARHALLPRLDAKGGAREAVVVGVSGGPDSVALLRVLHELAREELAITLVVAHLNHGLRGQAADEDQAFVEDLARGLALPCETAGANVRAEAAAAGIGIEEAGRVARRRFLAEAARSRGARKVALAHHADDRAETVLFNILRGTGIEGLASLGPRAPLDPKPEGIEIIRPLIETPRDLALKYLAAISQDCRQDETNQADDYTRNRVRNMLLPLLAKEFNPRVDEALVRLAEQASAAGDVLADALDEVWGKIVRETQPAAWVIDADDFALLRPWMQGAVIRRAVSLLGGGLKHMSAERTREIVDALLSKTVVGPIDLPGGLAAARTRRAIRIGRG
jgi:tRNA(Ile)-lysidine synthase